MKFNKYQLAAAGIAVAIIVIVVFTQRSDWDANKYILSADSQGNLVPKSEKYFDDKEKALIASVDQKIAAVNNRVTSVDNKVNVQRRDFNNRASHVDRHFTPRSDFNRLDAWSRTVGPWGDARFQPKGNYVEYGKAFNLRNQAKPGDQLTGPHNWGRGDGLGWYHNRNAGKWTGWYIT
jgi:hypothetical protein